MPSGRSGGGGGSRTMSSRGSMGGGSRTASSRGSMGGGGFSSGPSRMGPPPRRGPAVVVVGGGYYGSRWYHHPRYRRRSMGILGILAIICLILAIVGLASMSGAKSTMADIQTEHDYYVTMVNKANANAANYGIVTGKVIEVYKNDKGDKWWYTYQFDYGTYTGIQGQTYPVYTDAALNLSGTDVQLAVYDPGQGKDYIDSVPVDYKNTAVTDDGDYIAAQSSKSTGTMMMIIFIILFVVFLVGSFGWFAFLRKNKGGDPNQANSNGSNDANNNGTSGSTTASSQPQMGQCPYCGGRVSPTDTKCPNCGGTL